MSSADEALSCEVIEGNPDFYGLGIRIGVYLQWISAWVNLLVDPQSAQSVYDVNSVFVFAILVATMIATFAEKPTIRPIETHIMLQFALGFYLTMLSTFGLRLYFLRSASVAVLSTHLSDALRASRESSREAFREELRAPDQPPTSFSRRWLEATNSRLTRRVIPLGVLSSLRPHHLSWSGVVWRTATASMLATTNIVLWFSSQPNYQLAGHTCDPPFIFMFSKQQLSGPIVGFCQAVSIIIAVPLYIPSSMMVLFTIRLLRHAVVALTRDLMGYIIPKAPRRLRQFIDRIKPILEKASQSLKIFDYFNPASFPVMTGEAMLVATFLHLMLRPSEETLRFSDIFKLMVYLGRGRIAEQREASTQSKGGEAESSQKRPRSLERLFSISWNITIILTISWFMLSIGLTLAWNNFQGVNSINNTGQLIPFVIGCVSTGQVIKKVILLGLAKKYDDWADITLEYSAQSGFAEITKVRNTRNTPENDN